MLSSIEHLSRTGFDGRVARTGLAQNGPVHLEHVAAHSLRRESPLKDVASRLTEPPQLFVAGRGDLCRYLVRRRSREEPTLTRRPRRPHAWGRY